MNTDPQHERASHDGVQAEAADWVARRDRGLTAVEKKNLQVWLAADPVHGEAFAAADQKRSPIDWPLHAGAVDEVLAGLGKRRLSRRRRARNAGVAALAALLLGIGVFWQTSTELIQVPEQATGLTVVQPKRLKLPDGSIAVLREGGDISTDFSGALRRVSLVRGEVHFEVHHDPKHPFVVSSGGVEVRAVGTAFSVSLGADNVGVIVTEGRVAVDTPAAVASLPAVASAPRLGAVNVGAGSGVRVDLAGASAVQHLPPLEIEERLAWRTPRLEFSGTRLGAVIAEMNRHNRPQFVLADRSLEELRLSGTLRADKVDALVAMLTADFPVRVEKRDGNFVVFPRP